MAHEVRRSSYGGKKGKCREYGSCPSRTGPEKGSWTAVGGWCAPWGNGQRRAHHNLDLGQLPLAFLGTQKNRKCCLYWRSLSNFTSFVQESKGGAMFSVCCVLVSGATLSPEPQQLDYTQAFLTALKMRAQNDKEGAATEPGERNHHSLTLPRLWSQLC